jgi:glucosylceramidase
VKQLVILIGAMASLLWSCSEPTPKPMKVKIIQSTAEGDRLKEVSALDKVKGAVDTLRLLPNEQFQTVLGFGGAFTESSAFVLNQLSKENRDRVLQAYFGHDGARYSLTRTHMNSCDFSLGSYSYAPVEGDTALDHFSVGEDKDDIIPMIKDAMGLSKDGFKIIASPWTAPPWMKTNNAWYAGSLKKEYYPTWAKFFTKYVDAYREEGIDIWGFTVENEPLGNDSNWESMNYTPEEMGEFVKHHLGPELNREGYNQAILVYDQNRGKELEEWADVLLTDPEVKKHIYGTAVHWYTSTVDWYGESLQHTHELAPDKAIIHTEGCIDAEVPHWQDDAWYWSREATDWGWDWAKPEDKKDHPKYVPVFRYARDIIGCMNNWVTGWVDWNMVLDRQGGPNHANNWCIAPIIVDTAADEVYFTPLYDAMVHFSKYMRPEAKRIGWEASWAGNEIMTTSVQNEDGSQVVAFLNQTEEKRVIRLERADEVAFIELPARAIQTIIIE